jgi:transposase-like protein
MSKKQFTEEQIIALKGNPCVERVSALSVSFTEEFKRKSYGELLTGKPMSQIFREHGVDTEALGAVRVIKFQQNLNECAKRGDGFKNQRNTWQRAKNGETESVIGKRIGHLENEVAYLRQVVEFLKKSREADTEARKSWESKRRPK